ncbi:hypothetical protein B0H16DRAFT_1822184, partial [Mycena metata]
ANATFDVTCASAALDAVKRDCTRAALGAECRTRAQRHCIRTGCRGCEGIMDEDGMGRVGGGKRDDVGRQDSEAGRDSRGENFDAHGARHSYRRVDTPAPSGITPAVHCAGERTPSDRCVEGSWVGRRVCVCGGGGQDEREEGRGTVGGGERDGGRRGEGRWEEGRGTAVRRGLGQATCAHAHVHFPLAGARGPRARCVEGRGAMGERDGGHAGMRSCTCTPPCEGATVCAQRYKREAGTKWGKRWDEGGGDSLLRRYKREAGMRMREVGRGRRVGTAPHVREGGDEGEGEGDARRGGMRTVGSLRSDERKRVYAAAHPGVRALWRGVRVRGCKGRVKEVGRQGRGRGCVVRHRQVHAQRQLLPRRLDIDDVTATSGWEWREGG